MHLCGNFDEKWIVLGTRASSLELYKFTRKDGRDELKIKMICTKYAKSPLPCVGSHLNPWRVGWRCNIACEGMRLIGWSRVSEKEMTIMMDAGRRFRSFWK